MRRALALQLLRERAENTAAPANSSSSAVTHQVGLAREEGSAADKEDSAGQHLCTHYLGRPADTWQVDIYPEEVKRESRKQQERQGSNKRGEKEKEQKASRDMSRDATRNKTENRKQKESGYQRARARAREAALFFFNWAGNI